MPFIDTLKEIATALLLGYLAFTNALADTILEYFDIAPQQILEEETVMVPQDTQASTPEEPTIAHETLPQSETRSTGGPIPRILLENQQYQQAAVGAGMSPDPYSYATDTPLKELLTAALVNIFCQYSTETERRTTTGTGFFIHPKGVVLTNAHVAQFLLLEGRSEVSEARCTIRTGNPATAQYEADLLYLPPAWIMEHAALIDDPLPRGTGERDYALLYISRSADANPLPQTFPALRFNTELLSHGVKDSRVLVGGYPAEILLTSGADAALMPQTATTTIAELYTFKSNYADIFSIRNSIVGQHGASGGPVVDPDTEAAIGLVVTKGNPNTEGSGSLRALTLSYIDRTITEETGFSLMRNMQGDLGYRARIYNEALGQFLSGVLAREL